MSSEPLRIDRTKLRTAIRKLEDQDVFAMLYAAVDLLPESELAILAARFVPKGSVGSDGDSRRSLVAEAEAFDIEVRQGGYFESFFVGSKNCMDFSKGTRAFAAECRRLLELCVEESRGGDARAARAALGVLFDLLRAFQGTDDQFIFFADEGGLWALGIDWPPVLRAWFHSLRQTASPEEYARLALAAIDDLDRAARSVHLATALELADENQRKAISLLISQQA